MEWRVKKGNYIIFWQYRVRRGSKRRFERIYGPRGDWARLFRGARGYRGTELYRDKETRGRYVTRDAWTSKVAFAAFKTKFAAEYAALDRECEGLTLDETRIGAFSLL
jgi:heme-degrading monooxygenase HmoA